MSTFDRLDLEGRAALLGLTARAYVALAQSDPRIVRPPLLASDGAVTRLARWIAARQPRPDFGRLVYQGDGSVRAILVDTLAKLPAAFAWHCTEHICWLEVGRSAGGWQALAPTMRAPTGDSAHLIVLSGTTSDEALPHVIVHEAAHSLHRSIAADAPQAQARVPFPEQEQLARSLVAFDHDAAALARQLYAEEVLADDTARALGFPPTGHSSDDVRLRGFERAIAAVTNLADQIAHDIDQGGAIDRAAAIEGEP